MTTTDNYGLGKLIFGDEIENGHASHDNPRRRGFFVRRNVRTGCLHPGPYIELTDKRGNFWEVPLREGHRLTRVG